MAGSVYDTYAAALQHGKADLPADTVKIGVVRQPTAWFHPQVDENIAALGPPQELLDDVKGKHEQLEAQGVPDAEAHNAALEAVDYDARYEQHLARSEAAKEAVRQIRSRISNGEDVALVCYENTENKRCHRTLLKDVLRSQLPCNE